MTTGAHIRPIGLLTAVLATSIALVPAAGAEAAFTVVASYQMNETSSGSDRVMVDSGPFGLDGRIGDSIDVGPLGGGVSGYAWDFAMPDTPPVDPERIATVETSSYLNPGTADFAIEFRYRTNRSFGNVVQKGQSSTDGGYWKVEQPNGRVTCLFRRNKSDEVTVVSPFATNDGDWHTIRCERRASYARILVDGNEVARNNKSVGSIANSFPMTIGGKLQCNQNQNPDFPVGCDYFTGEIDWLRVHKDIPAEPNQPPTMVIASPECTGLTCTFDSSASGDPDGTIVDRAWDFGDGAAVEHQDVVATHSFPQSGTYTVSLVGTDDDGASSSPASRQVTVTGPANEPPRMRLAVSCVARTCTFDSAGSSDPDGTVTGRSWTFGDGGSIGGNASAVTHTYAADGVYTARLVGTDDGGAVDVLSVSVAVPWASKLVPLPPGRIFDTRPDEPAPGPKGIVRSGQSIDIDVTGVAGVPAQGVSAVAINLTALGLQAPGFIAARPAGTPESTTSNVNLVTAGEVRANLVIVPVGAGGQISLTTLRDAHLLGDIAGYFTSVPSTSDDGRIVTQVPQRLFDTRGGSAPGPKGLVGAAGTISVPVLGRAGVPAQGVAAVVLNVTATEVADAGFVTVWPKGEPRPTASSINVNRPGETVANQVIVPVGDDGSIQLYSLSAAHLLGDVVGWVTGDSATSSRAGLFVPIQPSRVLDTRPEEAAPGPKGAIPSGGTVRATMRGVGGVPATAGAVALNVTMIATAPGYITMWPSGSPQPVASSVNAIVAGDVRANGAVVAIGSGGQVDAYALTSAHLVADAFGYFLS